MIGERVNTLDRLNDKDAHDIYRILIEIETVALAASFLTLLSDSLSAETTRQGLAYLAVLFADGPAALGAMMAGRAEEGIGEPETVALSASLLAADLLDSIGR